MFKDRTTTVPPNKSVLILPSSVLTMVDPFDNLIFLNCLPEVCEMCWADQFLFYSILLPK